MPEDLRLDGVAEREKRFEGRAENVLRMMDRIESHLAAVCESMEEASDDEENSSEYSERETSRE